MNDYAEETTLDVTNPAPRCPVMLLLDTSGSMSNCIDELREGFRQFLRETSDDETASMSVELEVITFGGDGAIAAPFAPVNVINDNPPPLDARGNTPLGEALTLATRELKERRRLYKTKGISSYKPWVILMTDGAPNDDWEEPAKAMRSLGEQRKLQYIGIGIGEEADFDTLRGILSEHPGPVKLKGLCFREFFSWLTDSLKSVSASALAEQDKIQLGSVNSWADLAGTPAPTEE
ncbi:MAG: VWA domain-containing protein [Victivallales bacterium]|nr:VWA domain-containing protein [Victivallales bacterium]